MATEPSPTPSEVVPTPTETTAPPEPAPTVTETTTVTETAVPTGPTEVQLVDYQFVGLFVLLGLSVLFVSFLSMVSVRRHG